MSERPIMVIGGGPAGMEAVRGIIDLGYKAVLIEKRDTLGGTPALANYAALTPAFRDAGEAMAEMASNGTRFLGTARVTCRRTRVICT